MHTANRKKNKSVLLIFGAWSKGSIIFEFGVHIFKQTNFVCEFFCTFPISDKLHRKNAHPFFRPNFSLDFYLSDFSLFWAPKPAQSCTFSHLCILSHRHLFCSVFACKAYYYFIYFLKERDWCNILYYPSSSLYLFTTQPSLFVHPTFNYSLFQTLFTLVVIYLNQHVVCTP